MSNLNREVASVKFNRIMLINHYKHDSKIDELALSLYSNIDKMKTCECDG